LFFAIVYWFNRVGEMWQPTGSIALLKAYVRTKAAAKLLLFFDMTKFFARKMQIFLILHHIYDRLSLRNKNLTKLKLATA